MEAIVDIFARMALIQMIAPFHAYRVTQVVVTASMQLLQVAHPAQAVFSYTTSRARLHVRMVLVPTNGTYALRITSR